MCHKTVHVLILCYEVDGLVGVIVILNLKTMKNFRKKYFLFKSFVKVELCYVFTINMFSKTARKSKLSYYNRCFSLIGNYLRPSNNSRQLIFNINAVVLIVVIC